MAGHDDQAKPISLFYSYSHRDEDLRRKLETHLAALRRGGLIAEWHDRRIEPGDDWKGKIDQHLTSANIVLLLVSADFIDSDYCWGEEMTKALARHDRGEARVIPVILRYCRWQSGPLGRLQAVPKDGKPIRSWQDEDEAFDDVVSAIERSVQIARQKTAIGQSLSTARLEATTQKGASSRQANHAIFRDIEAPWCPEMVVIPAGRFVMGSPGGEEGRDPVEGPQHEVSFARPFALGRYPVTFEEYDHFCTDVGRKRPLDRSWGRGRRPAINVSWQDATIYCAWLSEQTKQTYRLPSEAEWEYACRAGTTTPFWTGGTIGPEQANYKGSYAYESGPKWRSQTTPVDTFEPNPRGLKDMHGNVWEWCEDCWNTSYEGAPNDGSAWLYGECSLRVIRGGSWNYRPSYMRSAYRSKVKFGERDPDRGFRVCRELIS